MGDVISLCQRRAEREAAIPPSARLRKIIDSPRFQALKRLQEERRLRLEQEKRP